MSGERSILALNTCKDIGGVNPKFQDCRINKMSLKLKFLLPVFGALPFIGCALLMLFQIQHIPVLGAPKDIIAVYGLVIASFMSGVYWGQHLHIQEDKGLFLLAVSSNINALFLWVLYLLAPFPILMTGIAISLVCFIGVDRYLLNHHIITLDYMRVRVGVTAIVLVSLLIAGLYS